IDSVATSYQEAINKYNINEPDVIFSDIVIPGGSGIEFIEYIKNLNYKGLVVVVSGYDNFSYAQKALKLGCFDYLLKPIFRNDYFFMLDKVKNSIKGSSIVKNEYYSEQLPAYIKKAMEIVERNYDRDIILDDIAYSSGVSAAYLSSSFSKYVNMTFIDFVKYYRVAVACLFLKNVNLTLAEIAEKVGFCDASYLTRCFKQIKGVAPGKYRKQLIEKKKSE
ncbi:MAG: AraC family transcriptional regulator, partial [Spirochaetaceae bacterium]|nr:AraC family transcriptional regulator [Spirochaetaceae bacterium]